MVTGLVTGEVLNNMEVQYTGTISHFYREQKREKRDWFYPDHLLNKWLIKTSAQVNLIQVIINNPISYYQSPMYEEIMVKYFRICAGMNLQT